MSYDKDPNFDGSRRISEWMITKIEVMPKWKISNIKNFARFNSFLRRRVYVFDDTLC